MDELNTGSRIVLRIPNNKNIVVNVYPILSILRRFFKYSIFNSDSKSNAINIMISHANASAPAKKTCSILPRTNNPSCYSKLWYLKLMMNSHVYWAVAQETDSSANKRFKPKRGSDLNLLSL